MSHDMLETTRSGDLVACPGCRALVPAEDGPTHAYLLAAPGCWRLYGEWTVARAYDPGQDHITATHHVDCYAVQHPGNADIDRRQRQSVAVHLVSLCLLLEFNNPPERANAVRGRASASVLPALGVDDWPHLAPPTGPPTLTIVDVVAADDLADRSIGLRWAEAAWSAWVEHHDTVRGWARILLSGKRGAS